MTILRRKYQKNNDNDINFLKYCFCINLKLSWFSVSKNPIKFNTKMCCIENDISYKKGGSCSVNYYYYEHRLYMSNIGSIENLTGFGVKFLFVLAI